MPIIGERVEKLRERQGLTIVELSQKLGVGTNTIWRWMHGKSQPNAIRLAELAEALNTSSNYLLGATDDPTPLPLTKTDITQKEYRLLDAYRRGDLREAMRLLLGDD